ncbi:hypothetical protein [Methylobacterium sp. 285MFTsu5.1]|uniref:hypothetical protein n=1 Tax=Methylobacterium sp. 285MFTsu5.1 TaxID=1172187 RepID=UPI001319E6AD|nr:hypothetical protein [Methylobacterium sp. 285MFTsu5.1]
MASLAACATSEGPAPVSPLVAAHDAYRVTLPPAPEGVEPCLRKAFPEIPDRALTRRDIVRIVGEAKVQDHAKTACGLRALEWIRRVRSDLARLPDR